MKCSSWNRNGTMCRESRGLLLVSAPKSMKTWHIDRHYRIVCRRHVGPREQIHATAHAIMNVVLFK